MDPTFSAAELDDRIAVLRDNIRQLIEQAAAASGEQTESRIADRLTQQNEELDKLTAQRDALKKIASGRLHAHAGGIVPREYAKPRLPMALRHDNLAA